MGGAHISGGLRIYGERLSAGRKNGEMENNDEKRWINKTRKVEFAKERGI